MSNDGQGKRKADECVEGESSRRCKAINNNDLQIDSYVNACQVFQDAVEVPAEFICGLSEAIMSEPVNLSTGQTVDRSVFENLFDVMPDDLIDQVTEIENLSSAIMTPDVELQTRIENWCEGKLKAKLRFQLLMLSYSQEYRVASARELRSITKDSPSYANAFSDLGPSAVLELVRPLLGDDLLSTGRSMHEDILVTIRQLSKFYCGNRDLLVQHDIVIYIILESLRRGNHEARLSAMILVNHIAAVPSCRDALVRSGIIEHLLDLLKSDFIVGMNHAVSALCELCSEPKYRNRVIRNGLIDTFSDHLLAVNLSGKYSRLLYQLSMDDVGLQQLVANENIQHWLLISTKNTGSSKVKEHSLATLSKIVPLSKAFLSKTFKHEIIYHLITKVLTAGTPASKQAAQVILQSLKPKQNVSGHPSSSYA